MPDDTAHQRAAKRYSWQAHVRSGTVEDIVRGYERGTVNDDLLADGWEGVRCHLQDFASLAVRQANEAAVASQVQAETRMALERTTEVLERATEALERATEALDRIHQAGGR